MDAPNHYEVLGIPPGSDDDAIRKGHKRRVTQLTMARGEVEGLPSKEQLDEARAVLLSPFARTAYDTEHFGGDSAYIWSRGDDHFAGKSWARPNDFQKMMIGVIVTVMGIIFVLALSVYVTRRLGPGARLGVMALLVAVALGATAFILLRNRQSQ
jgi:hypothetical protein